MEEFYKYPKMYCSIDRGDDAVPYGTRDFFKRHGYAVIKNLYDHTKLYETPPTVRGQLNYYGSIDKFEHIEIEGQVEGSLARYSYPKYKQIHTEIRLLLQEILGEELYNTYYYDRFYFPGQKLERHRDRHACEVSLSFQISKNGKGSWPFCLETLEGTETFVNIENGTGILYMGCSIDHWRDPLPKTHSKLKLIKNKFTRRYDPEYHHQIFFHYVRANGENSHYANDSFK